ncbi:MAG TPA: hypothetical protein DCY07_05770 [Rhodospirillaceae bacterium]|nr:hypothetical protein [Rhodospirillaceae bacterium]
MLQTMRDLTKSWIFKSLMMLLIVSFGIWGIGDMFRGNPNQREVAKIGAIEIPVQTLEQRFLLGMPEARNVFGADLTVAQARQIGVLDRTLRLMIEEHSFNQEAARLGLNIPNEIVMATLRKNPQLRDREGRFNTQLWHQILSKTGMSEQMFVDYERNQAARQILFGTLSTEIPAPKTMVDTLYQARGAKRVMEVITLRHESINNLPEASKEALEAYYKAHEDRYLVPEFRGLTVASLETEGLAKDITITEEQIKAAYETRAAELTQPETRDLVQIVFQEEEKAKAFHTSLPSPASFVATAKAKGLTPVTMVKISEKTILPELFATVFAVEEGQVSAPIKSDLGWHVVWVKTIHAGGKPTLDSVRGELKTILQEEHVGDLIASTVNKLDDMIASGKTLEECADTLKLRLNRYPALDQEGRDMDGREVKDIPNKADTLRAAFELGQGETGQVIDGGQGKYFVVRNDQIVPSHTKPFEEAKAKVIADWRIDQQAVKAATMAEEIAKALREGKPATSFASHAGISVTLSKPMSLISEPDKSVPAEAVSNIFKMGKGDVITAAGDHKHYILRLSDIVPVNPQKPEESRIKVIEDLSDKLPYNLVEQYILHLRKDFPVRVNQRLLDDLKNRGENRPE